jgi:anti-sigma factor (TIGR02949 family)
MTENFIIALGSPGEAVNCEQALQSITLFIDNEFTPELIDPQLEASFTIHFQECSPCESEKAHEAQVVKTLKNLLSQECCEAAPEDLHARLLEQTELLAAQMAAPAALGSMGGMGFGVPGISTQVTTTFSRTEITIDGETHIEIETSHEIRHDF